ncbi:hypothetical protein SeLEV6574_g04282 [Synchytrium endobioticum]|uniref:DNA-directed RNA polymerase II subunit RPB9 n=1 Tax=Synchytrium endobioticum TaxID=286115 RepID=A0A507D0V0_9FUNG|nr:hypothetical protein SeLEV6574_g04282 [Synchytrium endobioticum]
MAKASVAFQFCSQCHNLLYPRENREQKTLQLACRNCDYFEESDNPLFININIDKSSLSPSTSTNKTTTKPYRSEQSLQKIDLAQDPTLPRTRSRTCPRCDRNEAVFFQSRSKSSDSMILYFACVNCGHRWTDEDEAAANAERELQEAAALQEDDEAVCEQGQYNNDDTDDSNNRPEFQFHSGNTQSQPVFQSQTDDGFVHAAEEGDSEGHGLDDTDNLFNEEPGDGGDEQHHPEQALMDEDF